MNLMVKLQKPIPYTVAGIGVNPLLKKAGLLFQGAISRRIIQRETPE
jgi:hypothetical protein